MYRLIFLFSAITAFFAQDSLSVFEQARKHEDNLLRQLTKQESRLTFINIRDHHEAVNGKLEIEDLSFDVVDGKAIVPEDKIKMMNTPLEATFSGKDYIKTKLLLHHAFGAIDNIIFYVLDTKYPNKVQIVLNWDNRSGKYDLDSHLKGDNFHVYYRNKSSYGKRGSKVTLNRDVVRGNAYEMITIDKPSNSEEYRYIVRKYRGRNDWTEKNVSVTVYSDNTFRKRFNLRSEFGKSIENWLVFKLDSFGQIVSIDLKK